MQKKTVLLTAKGPDRKYTEYILWDKSKDRLALSNNKALERYFSPFLLLFPKRKILDCSKLKEFADEIFEFDKTGRNFSKR